jgi:hypothetical protein
VSVARSEGSGGTVEKRRENTALSSGRLNHLSGKGLARFSGAELTDV